MNNETITRNMLGVIRGILNENTTNTNTDAVAITDDPKFGNNVLSNQINAFKSQVDGGAQFSEPTQTKPNENPLVWFPSQGNLVLSGTIPSRNNLKFQFSLNDSEGVGCFIWVDGLRLTDENLQILKKIQGHFLNWQSEWQKEGKLFGNL